MADLHQKLTTLPGLLPSQRKWLERLVFQLDFNPYQLIFLVGGPGSGKTTVSLAVADLLSDDFNLALLTAEPDLSAAKIRQHLLEQWFGYGAASDKPLLALAGDRPSPQPLALIIDQSEYLPKELWTELDDLPCLVIATASTADPHAELNLPLAPPTMEDATQLLQEQNFSTLTVAERLEQAGGNLHVLLDPQRAHRQKTKAPAQLQPASMAGPLWTFTIGMAVILAVIVFWFWTERQQQSANGLGTLTYLPEEQTVAPTLPANKPAAVERQVVEQLVNELESVKLNQGNVSGLERPAAFDEQPAGADTQAPVTQTPATQTAVAQAPVSEPVRESSVAATEIAPSEPQQVTEQVLPETTTVPAEQASVSPSRETAATAAEPVTQDPAEAAIYAALNAETADPAPSSSPAQVSAAADDLAAEAAAEQSVEAAAVPADQSPAPVNTAGREAAVVAAGFDGLALQKLPASEFALQLVVFSNQAALNNFRQSYPQLKTYTYERTKDGKRQLVVVMAPFGSAAAAKAQARQLPAPLQQGFAKALADIHSEIRAN